MKLLHLTFQFQYTDMIEALLAKHRVMDYVFYPRIAGRDSDGKHTNSQAFPGHMTAVHAFVAEETVAPLLGDLNKFRQEKAAHRHLRAAILPVEQTAPDSVDEDHDQGHA